MSNAIIFGANGQDGYYLRQLLEASKIRVRSVSRSKDHGQGEMWAIVNLSGL
ncbi:MAG: hypothetical protein IPQ08_03210 [Chitinophagaceae bacterium]|nr:hypothetical protein [Chitinophagaceae bacterium]